MATKDSKNLTMDKNKETIKKVSSKVHEELLNTSHLFIDETVATLSRMQRITGKMIKKSEPILEKQIDITFDAVEAIKNQAEKGGKRALKLFGLTRQYNKLSNTIEEKVKEIPSVEEMIDDAKVMVGKAKSDVEEKIGELGKKLNIEELEKIGKISDVEKKVVAKTKKAKTAVKKAATKAKTTIAKEVKAKTTAKVKATTKKTTPARKAKATTKATVAKKAATAAKVQIAKSELTQIKGIGASLATIMADNGIKTIADLQNATPTALKVIAAKAGNRYKSYDTTKWIAAAKAVAK